MSTANGRIDVGRLRPAAALLVGCVVLSLTACGGGSSGASEESWTTGWKKDTSKPPVADGSVYVDWETSDEHPVWSPDGRWIAFDRSGAGIYRVRPDGRGLRRIWRGPAAAYPAWSPNGKWLAFSTAAGIVAVRPDGSNRRLLIRRKAIAQVKWSPDARAIAFSVANAEENINVFVKSLATGRPSLVARSYIGHELASFDWGRNGRELVLEVGDGSLEVLNLRTGSMRYVANGLAYEPAGSADRARIAFQCAGEICTTTANGGKRRVLTSVYGATEPAWSPDGRWVVFSRQVYGGYGPGPQALYRVSADGRHLRNITFGPSTRRRGS